MKDLRYDYCSIMKNCIKKIGCLLTSIIVGLMLVNPADAAWQPPAGIPPPSFGIDTPTYSAATHCPAWPSGQNSKANGQSYDCYYVDNSVACSDSNAGGYGTPNAPRCNIPQGTFSAGAYVDVRGGRTKPYTHSSEDRFGFSGVGTASNYIVISGKNAAQKPIINDHIHIGLDGSTSYFILEGFQTQGQTEIRPIVSGSVQTYISLRGNKMQGAGTFKSGEEFDVGLDNPNSIPTTISNIVFYNNESYDVGQWNSATEDDNCSFYVKSNVHYVWVVDNIMARSGGDGVAGGHNANRTSDHYYVGRNTISQNRENCVDIKEINNLIISENTCSNLTSTDTSNGEGIVVHYGANSVGPNEVWVLANTVYNAVNGVQVNTTGGSAYIIGNLLYNIKHDDSGWSPTSSYSNGAGVRIYSIGTAYVLDNTFYGYDTGIQFPNPGSSETYVAHGNIFSNRAASNGYEIYAATSTSRVALDHNLFYNPSGGAKFGWGSSSQAGLANIACSNCLESNPLFVSPTSDFRIQAGSPAIDVNTKHSVYSTYLSTYGVDISRDKNGVARPQGTGWDIGAYEYASGSTTTPPPPPPAPAPDTTAPTVPTSLKATVISSSEIDLSWNASTDDTSVTGYKVNRNGSQVGSVTTGTSYQDTGLSASTPYSYTVSAYDAAGNNSSTSSAVSATTTAIASPPPPVTSPPPSGSLNYSAGFNSTGLTLNGAAALSGTRLELTPALVDNIGSAFYSTPVGIQAFTTDFSFQLTNAGADGFAFVIQGNSPTAFDTRGGGGLGYGPDTPGLTPGIPKSVAIKFDLYDNAGEGTNSTGLYLNGVSPTMPSLDLTGSGVNLHSGNIFNIHVAYDGTALSWTITDASNSAAKFSATVPVDIPGTVGGTAAYVGFTGASGNPPTTQDILTWNYVTGAPVTQASAPAFSPAGGTYTSLQSVTISATAGSQIYYTTDGSTPTTSSALYTSPIVVTATTTIKAMATVTGGTNSPVASATYTLQMMPPAFSPAGGTYTTSQSVTVSEPGAQIYYTTDGSTPTTASTLETAPISVTKTTTVKAIAALAGWKSSSVASATYTINGTTSTQKVQTPTFTPAGGTYRRATSVAIYDATPGAQIYYTTNGSTPTTSSMRYTGPISVTRTTTIKAIAVLTGWSNSAIASSTYRIGWYWY